MTDSFTVSYYDNNNLSIASIVDYVHITQCECNTICECPDETFARIRKCKTIHPFCVNVQNHTLNFIHLCVEISNDVNLINVNVLKDVCFHVKFEDFDYICEPVNILEFE